MLWPPISKTSKRVSSKLIICARKHKSKYDHAEPLSKLVPACLESKKMSSCEDASMSDKCEEK